MTPSTSGGKRRRLGLLLAGLGLTAAAGLTVLPTADITPVAGTAVSGNLQFTQLKQVQNQWCWAASGLSIAQFRGKGAGVSQNEFCNKAHGYPAGTACPNQPDTLQTVQRGFQAIGLGAGSVSGSSIPFATVKSNIDAGKPIETGIYWTAGGGHAQVIYGYNGQTMAYGDPWPQSPTYNEMDYNSYVSNGEFQWGDALYNVG
ncbi:hypothetical protein D5S17_13505 [Pseudonocardiaceae bacterium YIM PH 21723]|nr:hypothetical protein D5S17_13505 [Pseudonocardiaceae bacterium YIM PH 21723]